MVKSFFKNTEKIHQVEHIGPLVRGPPALPGVLGQLFCHWLQGAPGHGKSWNLGRPFSRPGKSWKIAKVMENDDNVMEFLLLH